MTTNTNQSNGVCAHCEQPLVRVAVGKYYRLMCDNAEERCILFRESQGNIPNGEPPNETPKGLAAARRYLAGNPARKVVTA